MSLGSLNQQRPSLSVGQVGSRIIRFVDCSVFTRVMGLSTDFPIGVFAKECFCLVRYFLDPLRVLPVGVTS